MSWSEMAETWLVELAGDPAYETVVTPLLLETLEPQRGCRYLDLGCGEGRVMRALAAAGALAHGLDISFELARSAGTALVAALPTIPVRSDAYDGVYAVLSLEHVEDHGVLFAESARVTGPGGFMAVVMNHPFWTAPGSTPITDGDGEVLWRPGVYFAEGRSSISVGGMDVVFHHRSMAGLLEAAARAGWSLDRITERPHHDLSDQAGIARLLACRWRLLP